MKIKLLTAIFTLSISGQSLGQEILAKKEGLFNKFNSCSIGQTNGTIKLSGTRGFELEESSEHNEAFYHYDKLVIPTLSAIGPVTYRWYPSQVDYSIKGSDELLTKFFAYGFRNIRNESTEAKKLRQSIDRICDELLNDFQIIGKFQINLKIADTIFEDELIITRTSNETFTSVKGLYKVPNSFEAKVKQLKYSTGKFTFLIEVKEGQDEYDAFFEGEFLPSGKMQGRAYILPDQRLLGIFSGKRL